MQENTLKRGNPSVQRDICAALRAVILLGMGAIWDGDYSGAVLEQSGHADCRQGTTHRPACMQESYGQNWQLLQTPYLGQRCTQGCHDYDIIHAGVSALIRC